MMLLQRVAIRDASALEDVVVDFYPRGRHAILGTPDELAAVRRAVRVALFGIEPEDVTASGSRGGRVELDFVAGGTPYTISRPLSAEAGDGPWLLRHGGTGREELREAHRIRRALRAALGLDSATFTTVTDVMNLAGMRSSITPRDLVRRLLGEGRADALTAAFGSSPELEATEAHAAARLELAEAAATLAVRTEAVVTLASGLDRARIRRAVQGLEAAQRSAAAARQAATMSETLVARFAVAIGEARAARRLHDLWRERRRHQADWARATERRRHTEASLTAARELNTRAGQARSRLDFAERALDAFAEAQEAAQAADVAREERRALEADLRETLAAQSELDGARSRAAAARTEATRAETMHRRAREDAYLPAAHRLWTQWVECAGDARALERDRDIGARLDQERDAAERVALDMLHQAGDRRTRLTLAGAGVTLGSTIAVIGAIAAAPVLPLGLIGAVGAGAWAAWLAWTGRESTALHGELDAILDQIAKDRRAVEARLAAHAERARRRLAVEQELRAMEFEVPAARERAELLLGSATARLQLASDSDRRASATDRAEALAEARRRLERAEGEVRRLEARATAADAPAAEVRLAEIEARVRASLETAARAQQRATASARAAGLADAVAEITRALHGLRAEHVVLQARLDELPKVELSHQAAVGEVAAAADALRNVEAVIANHLREHRALPAGELAAVDQPRHDARLALIDALARHGETHARRARR
ncbi:MAG: hypothetical protein FJ029_08065, partial [Actinobacteria bacterium]|nr:hypothetical protein [Actinomycetota bacterium]